MKLPPLNTAIRNADTVRIRFNLGNQIPISVAVQKSTLLEALKEAFPDRGETGLYIRDDGFIMKEEPTL